MLAASIHDGDSCTLLLNGKRTAMLLLAEKIGTLEAMGLLARKKFSFQKPAPNAKNDTRKYPYQHAGICWNRPGWDFRGSRERTRFARGRITLYIVMLQKRIEA